MLSVEAEKFIAALRERKGAPYPSVIDGRKQWQAESEARSLPEGTKTKAVVAGGVICEWVQHADCTGEGVLLWMHGGGMWRGGPITHRRLAAYLSQATNMRVLVPDFRLAPEHPFPAAVHDCLSVYGSLLTDGVAAGQIVLGGDSAGAGLACAVLLALKEASGEMPAALVMLSPWLDLTCSSESVTKNATADPSLDGDRLGVTAAWYFDQADPKNPLLSPLFADLSGFPPTHIQVSDNEILLDDSRLFAQHAKAAGVIVDLQVKAGLWHVWHHQVAEVPEADEGIGKLAAFVAAHLPAL